jgi:hypothetical protein
MYIFRCSGVAVVIVVVIVVVDLSLVVRLCRRAPHPATYSREITRDHEPASYCQARHLVDAVGAPPPINL